MKFINFFPILWSFLPILDLIPDPDCDFGYGYATLLSTNSKLAKSISRNLWLLPFVKLFEVQIKTKRLARLILYQLRIWIRINVPNTHPIGSRASKSLSWFSKKPSNIWKMDKKGFKLKFRALTGTYIFHRLRISVSVENRIHFLICIENLFLT